MREDGICKRTSVEDLQWCNYAVNPKGTQCDAFPGDLIFDDVSRQMYFVESYGEIIVVERQTKGH